METVEVDCSDAAAAGDDPLFGLPASISDGAIALEEGPRSICFGLAAAEFSQRIPRVRMQGRES
jgi:hypothetical protein